MTSAIVSAVSLEAPDAAAGAAGVPSGAEDSVEVAGASCCGVSDDAQRPGRASNTAPTLVAGSATKDSYTCTSGR